MTRSYSVIFLICGLQIRRASIPIFSLKGFKRVLLKVGEINKVNFTFNMGDLMQFNTEGEKAWMKGRCKIMISNALPGKRSVNLGSVKLQRN